MSQAAKPLRWGIISTGAIARAFATGLSQTDSGTLAAVASRTQDSADAFAKEFDIPTAHGSYEALLADDGVDAVYIATPHPMHPEWAIKAAEAGKHVLCEKPVGLNQWQAQAMIEAARRAGVTYMEAFMYRCHPQTAKLVELLKSGVIGQVRVVQAAFGFDCGPGNPEGRAMNPELGGGGILDVGTYPVSMSRLVAGVAAGLDAAADPVEVKGVGRIGETGVDDWAATTLKFDSGVVATCQTAVQCNLENRVVVYGSAGKLELANPWCASRNEPSQGQIVVTKQGEDPETIDIPTDRNSYAHEADVFAAAVAAGTGQAAYPAMTWDDTVGNLAVLDAWRQQIGLAYPQEQPRPEPLNLGGKPVKSRADETGTHGMQYARIPGVDKPVSKFIFGALVCHGSFAKAQVMYDHWLEVGGYTFDTSYQYGPTDKVLGQWMTSRGVRDDLVLVAKGAHTPDCNPEALTRQLHETLDNFNTDHTEVYIMHRDNPDIPVGEFIDVLNEHKDAGRIQVFGGSNWSIDRFLEANEYAKNNGKQGMTILNNNLSLALMVDPVWGGCIHVSDRASLERMAEHDIVHFAWSSQARGFFTDRSGKDKLDDPEIVRCWYSDENFERKARAVELAEQKGCLPINIAAAYVLCQPFPSFALIGPERVREIDTSLPALDVTLTPDELAYLAYGE